MALRNLQSQNVIKWQMGLTLVILIFLTASQTYGFAFGRIKLASFQAEPLLVIRYFTSLSHRYMELALIFVLYSAVKKKNLTLFRTWCWSRSGIYILDSVITAINEFLKDLESQSQNLQEVGNPWMVTNILFLYFWWACLVLDMLCLPIHLRELEVPIGEGRRAWTKFQFVPLKRIILIQCPFYLLPISLNFFVYSVKIVKYFSEDVASRGDYYLLGMYIFLGVLSTVVLPLSLLLYKGLKRGDISKLMLFYKLHLIFIYVFAFSAGIRRILDNRSHEPLPNSFTTLGLNLFIIYYFTNYLLLNIFLLELTIQLRLPKTLQESLFESHSPDENKSCKSIVSQNSDFFRKITIPQRQIEVCVEDKLGEGQFGKVYKALKFPARGSLPCFTGTNSPEVVAVKILKHGSDQLYAEALLQELKILNGVGRHEYLLRFYGCCVWSNVPKGQSAIAIIVEYCSLGSLETYLKSLNASKIIEDISELLRFSFEISEGMNYLETKRIIHADLAARNILLDTNKSVKITDFGMSLQLYYYQTYARSNAELFPWKSMAPEALADLKFSSKSDVWSYGILLFEIFSLGEDPYSGLVWTSHVVQELNSGLRPSKPKLGGNEIFEIMSNCWQLDPGRRPGFKELSMRLARLRHVNV